MKSISHFAALVLLLLVGCGPSSKGGKASVREAAVVIMGERLSDPTDGSEPSVEQYPECMGLAVGPETILTSDHCQLPVIDQAFVVVTVRMWETTASGNVLADMVSVRGETRVLKPRVPVDDWCSVAAPAPGAAKLVVVRDTEIVELEAVLTGDQYRADAGFGDSGAPVEQGGHGVGLVQTCNGSAENVCDFGSGRFSLDWP